MTDKRRWISLYVLCMGMLMIVLDATVVNVALPAIQDDLGFTQSGLAWVVNAYLISFGGLLLLAGRLGDLASRKGMFLVGLAVFTVASLLCGLAQSQVLLVAARFVQGAGGAMTSAVILGMIVTMFPEPQGAGQGHRRLRLRCVCRRGCGLARRRRAHPVHKLALDLLRQRPRWHRDGGDRRTADRDRQGHRVP